LALFSGAMVDSIYHWGGRGVLRGAGPDHRLYQMVGEVAYKHLLPIALLIGLGFGLAWVRREPVVTIAAEVTPRVALGGKLSENSIIVKKRSDCTVTVMATMVDSQTVKFELAPIPPFSLREKGEVYVKRDYPVPFGMSWGKARLQVDRTYYCWPFYERWPITKSHPPLYFEVLKP
jgi:hypothetical protein